VKVGMKMNKKNTKVKDQYCLEEGYFDEVINEELLSMNIDKFIEYHYLCK